ncbi:mitochondrial peripheral inner membrane protein [Agyrium rufum]|nr:mitochondrial peripheral inner membrane protein [Agyrium rufum]
MSNVFLRSLWDLHGLPRVGQHMRLSHGVSSVTRRLQHSRSLPTNPVASRKRLFNRTSTSVVLAIIGLGYVGFLFASQSDNRAALDSQRFSPFTLIEKKEVSATSSIFTLLPSRRSSDADYKDIWRRGTWSVEVKQPQLQVSRLYTPLPQLHGIILRSSGTEGDSGGKLSFLIRHDGRGEVSNYLNALRIGSTVELRGPKIEYEIPTDVEEVVCLAGGTGIAPMVQAAYTLLYARDQEGKNAFPLIRFMIASRTREECPLRPNEMKSNKSDAVALSTARQSQVDDFQPVHPIMQALRQIELDNPGQIALEFYVDEEETFIDIKAVKRALRIERKQPLMPSGSTSTSSELTARRRLILVSGPNGFVNYLAGSKQWHGGKEVQGPLGGLLAETDTNGWEVRKF